MAVSGFGATLTIESDTIADITSIKPPANSVADADITTLDAGGVPPRQCFLPIKVDPGEGDFECLYSAATYSQLEALVGDVGTFVITFPDSGTLTFQGFISKGPETENNQTDAVRIKCSYKASCVPSFHVPS